VVHDLVVGALQEGRVDRGEWLEALGGQTSGKGYAVLLGNADVKGALGERLGENIDPGAGRHRRGHGDDLVVFLGLLGQALAKYLGVGGRIGLGLVLLAGRDIELYDAVVFIVGSFRRGVALA